MNEVLAFLRRHKLLSWIALSCVPDWHWNIHVPGIGRFRIRLRRNRSLWIRHPFFHEWYPLSVLKSLVRPTDVVWDVGANLGLYSRILVQCLHAKHVYAFEPMSENLPELQHNLKLGGVEDRVTVLPWALSNHNEMADFQIDDIQSASGALDAVCEGKASPGRAALDLPAKVERVQCRTLDSILQEGGVSPPDVIKVDVEGAERMFLDGGERFFTHQSPRVLIETHGIEVTKASLEFLFSKGYYIAGCVPDEWHPTRHLRLSPTVLQQVTDRFSVHFIVAAKQPEELPAIVERDVRNLVNFIMA